MICFGRSAVQAAAGGPDGGGGDEAQGSLRILLRVPCCRPGLGQVGVSSCVLEPLPFDPARLVSVQAPAQALGPTFCAVNRNIGRKIFITNVYSDMKFLSNGGEK